MRLKRIHALALCLTLVLQSFPWSAAAVHEERTPPRVEKLIFFAADGIRQDIAERLAESQTLWDAMPARELPEWVEKNLRKKLTRPLLPAFRKLFRN